MSEHRDHRPDFEALIRANTSRLRRIARSYAGVEEHEDLLQEILLQLWRSRSTFRGASKPDTWLYRVALNTAISYRRRRPAPPTTDRAEYELGTVGDPVDPGQLLLQFLAGLNAMNRSVMVLSLEGLEPREIADVLGSSKGAIAVRLTRLKQRFEEHFLKEAS